MEKSDVQETLVHLYLRLNGYFISGFLVHSCDRLKTELDVLAVRFPQHEEPAREIDCCDRLSIPRDTIDFIVGEVKGGQENVNFNDKFRGNPDAVRSVLQRFGAFSCDVIDRTVGQVSDVLRPERLRKSKAFPTFLLPLWSDADAQLASLRFIPFAAGRTRNPKRNPPYIFQDDMLNYAWNCFRPEHRRPHSDPRYNFENWGPQFVEMVKVFKKLDRTNPPTLDDLYSAYRVCHDDQRPQSAKAGNAE